MYKVYFAVYLSSRKCDYFENIRRFFGILFAYIEKILYFCTRLGIKCIVWHENIPFKV